MESLLDDEPGVLAPPEADPDFDESLDGSPAPEELAEPDEPGVADELDEPDGLDGLVELPLDGELDEDDGGVPLLPLPLLPLLPDLLPPLSWPQAARPKAKATATARVESFMSPPWLGYT